MIVAPKFNMPAIYFFQKMKTEKIYGAFGSDVDCVNTTNVKSVSFTECSSRCIDVFTTIVGYYPTDQFKGQNVIPSFM